MKVEAIMPSGEKDRNSVYQKALVIVHEDEKQLRLMQKELEKDRLQKYIDYKLEAKRLQKELLTLRQEQLQLMNQARKNQLDNKTVDDIAKESLTVQSPRNRNLEAMKLKKKFSLPIVTPTQRNIPRIMKRNLSYESEYFTWTFGLPQLEQGSKRNATEKQRKLSTESKENYDSTSENNFPKVMTKKELGSLKNCPPEIALPVIAIEEKPTDKKVETSKVETKLPSIT